MFYIGLGKFNKYYWNIILSALFKLLINGAFKIDFQNYKEIDHISFLKDPQLNNHIFMRFIYYYLGFICLGALFQKIRIKNQKSEINKKKEINSVNTPSSETRISSLSKNILIHKNYLSETSKKSFWPLFPSLIIYILNEMIIFYFNQKNYDGVNFWVLQIFFIHILLFKKKTFKLYKHQILSFAIIIILCFGIKFISSFLEQCDFPIRDPNNIDEEFKEKIKTLDPQFLENERIMEKINKTIRESIIKNNEEGTRACKNMYNLLILKKYFEYFIIISALGYLLGLFLHSYSAVKFKYFIDEKYISPYLIIIFIGLIGFFGSILFLIIASFIPCGSTKYISNFCHSAKNNYNITDKTEKDFEEIYYLDNFLLYIGGLNDAFHPKIKDKLSEKIKGPLDGILEIIFSFLLSIFGFFKTTYDFNIIKELGVFHLLFPEVIYQFIKDIIIIIYKIAKDIIDKVQITQFIFIGITNIFSLIGFGIYLELIEVRFCGFDENIKENIILRSLMETKGIEEVEEENFNEGRENDENINEIN